jgi:hypothetical protein
MAITGGPDGHVPYLGMPEWPSPNGSPQASAPTTPPPPKR